MSYEDAETRNWPARAFTLANIGVRDRVWNQIKDADFIELGIFVLPYTSGYKVIVISRRELDSAEQSFIWDEAKEALDEGLSKAEREHARNP